MLSVLLWLTYIECTIVHYVVCPSLIDIYWLYYCPLCCLSFFDWHILIVLLSIMLSVLLWLTYINCKIVHYVVCPSLIDIYWLYYCPLCCLSFFDWHILIAHLISSNWSYKVFESKKIKGHSLDSEAKIKTIKGHKLDSEAKIKTIKGHKLDSEAKIKTIKGHKLDSEAKIKTIKGH